MEDFRIFIVLTYESTLKVKERYTQEQALSLSMVNQHSQNPASLTTPIVPCLLCLRIHQCMGLL
jgi:hypothetical protein